MPHRRHRDPERADDRQQRRSPIDCVMAERAFTRALGGVLRIRRSRASACSRTATFGCARRSVQRGRRARWSRTARCSTAATTTRRKRWRARMLERAPESIRRLFAAAMRRLLVLRPEPGASATVERARAAAASTPSRFRCSRSSRSSGTRRTPAAFDALLLTSANAVRHRRDRSSSSFAALPGPCRRRGDRRRGARGRVSTSPAPAMPGSSGCSARSSRTFDCSTCAANTGELRTMPGRRSRRSSVYRSTRSTRRRTSARLPGSGRADPFAARRAALRGAGRPSRHRSALDRASPRSAPRPRTRPAMAGSGRVARQARTTTHCWPLRHGCATSRTGNERELSAQA